MANNSSNSGVHLSGNSVLGTFSDSEFSSIRIEEVVDSLVGENVVVVEGGYSVQEVDEYEWVPSGLDMVVFVGKPSVLDEVAAVDESMKANSEEEFQKAPVIQECETVDERSQRRERILKDLKEMRSIPKKRSSARIQRAKLAKKIPQDEPISLDSSGSEKEEPATSENEAGEKESTPNADFCPGETSKSSLFPTSSKRVNPQRSSRKRSAVVESEFPPPAAKKLRTRTTSTLAETSTARPKEILDDLIVSKEFLDKNYLLGVRELLKVQGLLDLFAEEDPIDKVLIGEFFNKVTKTVKGNTLCLHFEFKGQELMVTSKELAAELKLKHVGFETYAKKQWPEEMKEAEIEERQRLVCNLYEPNVNELSTNEMAVNVKVLHRLLVHSLLPRQSKNACAQIQDILVLSKMLNSEDINWPKLFLHHLHYISAFKEVGYGRIVKRILQMSGVYEPQEEKPASKSITQNSLHRWGFIFCEEGGWIKKDNRAKAEVQKPKIPENQDINDEIKDTLARLENLAAEQQQLIRNQQKEIAELRELVQKGFRKLRKCIKEQNKSQESSS